MKLLWFKYNLTVNFSSSHKLSLLWVKATRTDNISNQTNNELDRRLNHWHVCCRGVLPCFNIPPRLKNTIGETWTTKEAPLPRAYFIILTIHRHLKLWKQHNKYVLCGIPLSLLSHISYLSYTVWRTEKYVPV